MYVYNYNICIDIHLTIRLLMSRMRLDCWGIPSLSCDIDFIPGLSTRPGMRSTTRTSTVSLYTLTGVD